MQVVTAHFLALCLVHFLNGTYAHVESSPLQRLDDRAAAPNVPSGEVHRTEHSALSLAREANQSLSRWKMYGYTQFVQLASTVTRSGVQWHVVVQTV